MRDTLPVMTATVTPPDTTSLPSAPPPPPLERTSYGDRVFRAILTTGAVSVPVLLGFLVYQLWTGSELAISKFGLGFLTSSTWDPVAEEFGAFPLIFGTLISSFIALLIAVPLSLGVAIFLTEFAPKAIRQPIAFLIGLLAAIPSVVYGLWGIFVLVPLLRTSLFPFLRETLGFLPLFQGPIYGPSMRWRWGPPGGRRSSPPSCPMRARGSSGRSSSAWAGRWARRWL